MKVLSSSAAGKTISLYHGKTTFHFFCNSRPVPCLWWAVQRDSIFLMRMLKINIIKRFVLFFFSLLTKLGNYIKWDLCQSMPFSRHLQGACLQRFLSFSESFILVHICFNCLTKARTNCKCCPIYTVKVYNVIGINENNIPSSTSLIQHPRTRCLLCIIHLYCM